MKTKRLLFTFLILIPVLSNAQWQMVHFDQHNLFHRVVSITTDDVVVLGSDYLTDNDFILRSHNSGLDWDSIPIDPQYRLTELFFSDVNNGYAAGKKNGNSQALLKTSDNGSTWVDITPDTTNTPIVSVYFIDNQKGYASNGHTLYSTTTGGETWNAKVSDFFIWDLNFSDMMHGTASGTNSLNSEGVILSTSDGGETWNIELSVYDQNFFVSSFDKIDILENGSMFSSLGNSIFHSSNGGLDWNEIVIDSVYQIKDFDFLTDLNGHILSTAGQIFSTNDGGETWNLDYTTEWGFYGPFVYLHALSFADPVGFVVGTNGLIKRYGNIIGIADHGKNEMIQAWPNPSISGSDLFLTTGNTTGITTIKVISLTGQIVWEKQLIQTTGSPVKINNAGLCAGIYTVSVSTENSVETTKLLILK